MLPPRDFRSGLVKGVMDKPGATVRGMQVQTRLCSSLKFLHLSAFFFSFFFQKDHETWYKLAYIRKFESIVIPVQGKRHCILAWFCMSRRAHGPLGSQDRSFSPFVGNVIPHLLQRENNIVGCKVPRVSSRVSMRVWVKFDHAVAVIETKVKSLLLVRSSSGLFQFLRTLTTGRNDGITELIQAPSWTENQGA